MLSRTVMFNARKLHELIFDASNTLKKVVPETYTEQNTALFGAVPETRDGVLEDWPRPPVPD